MRMLLTLNYVSSSPQKALVILGKIVLVFECESWGDDAERMKKVYFLGRAISLGARLKFESWIDRDGNQRNKLQNKSQDQCNTHS